MPAAIKQSARSPTLDTVLMVEREIEKHGGESRTFIWRHLPKKVMWQTYLVILDYLASIKHIGIDREGNVAYLHNPKLAKRLRKIEKIEPRYRDSP